ncbi:MAG: hypothetical protein ACOYLQ_00485 [Hyphomicrobiaceae bacterium]
MSKKDFPMHTHTLDGAQFVREARRGGILKFVRSFVEAVGDSLSAAHEYKRLTASGVQPADAARKVFETKIDRR